MSNWHPATKALALLALLVLPYLLWTRSDEGATPVVASAARAVTSDVPAGETAPPPAPFELPPLEQLSEIVERPLFSPTRRMPPPPPRVAVAAPVAPVAQAPSGLNEPQLRFFGTIRQGGVAAALVTYPGTGEVARLRPGDQVGDWQVLSVDGNHLELGLGEERRSYEIFAAGAGAGASTEKDTEHAPASDADSPDDPGDAAPPADDAGTDDALPGNDAGPDDASPAAQ